VVSARLHQGIPIGFHSRATVNSHSFASHRALRGATQTVSCRGLSHAMANGPSFASHCAFRQATQTVSMWLPLSCYGQRSQFCIVLCFQRGHTNCSHVVNTLVIRSTVTVLLRSVLSATQHKLLCEFPIHVSRLTASVFHRFEFSAMQHKLFPSVSHSRIMGNGLSFAPHCVLHPARKTTPLYSYTWSTVNGISFVRH
jgi:hypothetical protein